jgi:hypothetical protein
MLDPIMAVFRPLAAFVTAFFSGIMENFISKNRSKTSSSVFLSVSSCTDNDCNCHNEPTKSAREATLGRKLSKGIYYAFSDLLGDIAYYLLIGLIFSGIISALVPSEFFTNYLSNEMMTMLIMLVVGIPMYVCASASTPIAAALILKGISPGAALVFLLAGPATNLSTMATVKKMLGRVSFISYLLSISLTALLLGFLLNAIYAYFNISMKVNIGTASEWVPEWLKYGSAVILLPLLFRGLFKEVLNRIGKK